MLMNKNTRKLYYFTNAVLFFITATPFILSICSFVLKLTGQYETDELLTVTSVYFPYVDAYVNCISIIGICAIFCALSYVVIHIDSIAKWENIVHKPWFYLFGALLLWASLSTALSDEPLEQFIGGGKLIFDNLFLYYIYAACLILASTLGNDKQRAVLIRFFCIVTTWSAAIMYGQVFGVPFICHCFPTIGAAVFTNYNYFAYVLCMSVTALAGLYLFDENAGKIRKTLYLLGFVFQFSALLINGTFGCYLAVLAALPFLYLCYFRSGKKHTCWIWVPAILFLLISAADIAGILPTAPYMPKNGSVLRNDLLRLFSDFNNVVSNNTDAAQAGSGRGELWAAAIERIKERPIFGYGPEGFDDMTKFDPYGSPHNDILQIAAYLGIPALIFYLAALFTLARHLWKSMKELSPTTLAASGVVVCYLASSMFGHPVYNTTPFFWMFLGMITLKNEQDEPLFSGGKTEKAGRKEWIVLISLALFCGICVLIGAVRSAPGNEKPNEYADLQAMRCAEVSAMGVLKNEEPDGITEYWYDADEFRLIPLGEEPTRVMGKGTTRVGGGMEQYLSEGNPAYDYDEALDYTTKTIRVTVDPETEEIKVFWAEAEEGK